MCRHGNSSGSVFGLSTSNFGDSAIVTASESVAAETLITGRTSDSFLFFRFGLELATP
jgi:hypothetical protein